MAARILFTFILCLLPACNWRNPEDRPLERQQFASLYAELTASLWNAKRSTADTLALAHVADSVLAAHSVSHRRYDATLAWFNADPERWKGFFDEVGGLLDNRAKEEALRRHE
jgi:hypothetical protein